MDHAFSFFAETYETERLKTLSVWSQFDEADSRLPAGAARPHAARAHGAPVRVRGRVDEDHAADRRGHERAAGHGDEASFIDHYAKGSGARLDQLRAKTADWFGEQAKFFDVQRTRAWIVLRRIAHSAHHRGQLHHVYLRLLGRSLYSTYGPTADTGGLFQEPRPRHLPLRLARGIALRRARRRAPPSPCRPGGKPPTERP